MTAPLRELLGCPFCGKPPRELNTDLTCCQTDACPIEGIWVHQEDWNRRPHALRPGLVKAREELLDQLGHWETDRLGAMLEVLDTALAEAQ